jgi:aspartyl-tRNA(Asn)/glutamyl-tRNA(Gln) amidotransferase subunit A
MGWPVGREAAGAAEAAVRTLAARGVAIEDAAFAMSVSRAHWFDLFTAGYAHAIGDRFAAVRDQLSPLFASYVEQGQGVTAGRYLAAQVAVTRFIEETAGFFERYDLLALPTTPVPAFPAHLELGPDEIDGQAINPRAGWAFTWPFNLTGQPAISIPCGWSADGLPLGLQLVGRHRADGLVLRAAAAVEAALPRSNRRPPLTATV